MKHSKLILPFSLLILVGVFLPNVHAAPTLTIFPASVVTNQNTAASYIVNLNGGTPNATYEPTVTGLPDAAVYSFSSDLIGPSGSSVLTIQTSIASPLYCPRSYAFTVTATNTLLSSDSASATGRLGINQVGSGLVVSISTDKSTYIVGETVAISIVTNRPAEGTLTISPPSGSPSSFRFQYPIPAMKPWTVIPPAGSWTVTFLADDYCGVSNNAVVRFNVAPSTIFSTNTTTTTYTIPITSTSTSVTGTTTSATSTTTSTAVTSETGTGTLLNILTSATTNEQTAVITTTLTQSSTTSTILITKFANPDLELALGSILTISVLAIAISLIRRPRLGDGITCGKCGFKNPLTASSYCVKCGQPLKRRPSQ
ncbi:MAG: hypothetical protein ABSA92_08695 [Candidatus Bathyarchaeia archaeon]